MTAVGGDLALIGSIGAKVAVATLLEGRGFREAALPGDHLTVALRPTPDIAAPFDLERTLEAVEQPPDAAVRLPDLYRVFSVNVYIEATALATLRSEARRSEDGAETGGILLGYELPNGTLVMEAGGPGPRGSASNVLSP